MRDRLVRLTVVAVPAAAAGLVLVACAGSSAAAPGPGASGMTRPRQDVGSRVSDALAALVDDGVITSVQKDAVVEALDAGRPARGPDPRTSPPSADRAPATKAQARDGGDMVATILDGLVEDGTMNEGQADAIAQALHDALPDMPGARSPPGDASGV